MNLTYVIYAKLDKIKLKYMYLKVGAVNGTPLKALQEFNTLDLCRVNNDRVSLQLEYQPPPINNTET